MGKKSKPKRAATKRKPAKRAPNGIDPGTPETRAKLPRDLLRDLEAAAAIEGTEAAAGRAIVDCWELITGPVDIRTRERGYSGHDSAHAERLQTIWRLWAPEVFNRCFVRPPVIVEWLRGTRTWDREATPTLARALRWWLDCARIVRGPITPLLVPVQGGYGARP